MPACILQHIDVSHVHIAKHGLVVAELSLVVTDPDLVVVSGFISELSLVAVSHLVLGLILLLEFPVLLLQSLVYF